MNVISELPVYWLNFLLHSALLSVFVYVLCLALRDPGRRAFAAASGVLAIAVVPWVSAFGLLPESRGTEASRSQEVSAAEAQAWSGWVIRISGGDTKDLARGEGVSLKPVPAGMDLGWKQVATGLWLAGGLVGFLVVGVRMLKLFGWCRSLREATDQEWLMLEPHAAGGRKRFLVSGGGSGPCAIGFLRQRVVVPESFLGGRGNEKLRWLVRHESEHVKGGDPRLAVLLSLAACVVWWNPVVHLLTRRWVEDRERVCDARALEMPEEGRGYGAFLLDLSERWTVAAGVPMASSGGAERLKKRLQALIRNETVAAASARSAALTLAALLAGGMIVSCVGMKAGPEVREVDGKATPRLKSWKEAGNAEDGKGRTRSAQIKILAKFLRSDKPFPEVGRILTDHELQLMMRRAAQRKGTDLMTVPSVMARTGQETSVTIVRTAPEDQHAKNLRKVPFVGLSLISTPVIKAKQVELSVDCLWNYEPGRQPMDFDDGPNASVHTPPKDFDWKTVRSVSVKKTRVLSAGESMVVAFEGVPRGKYLTGIFTAEAIDPAGNAVEDFGVRFEDPRPFQQKPAFRIRGGILEVPGDKDTMDYLPIPRSALENGKGELWRKQTPEQVRDYVRRHHKDAKWTDLEPLTIDPDLPEAAWRISDFKLKLEAGRHSRGFEDVMHDSAALGLGDTVLLGFNRVDYVKEAKGQPKESLFYVVEKLPR